MHLSRNPAGRLIVVSNRVAPITEGEPTAGGLAAGVMDALRERGGVWFGWSGEASGRSGTVHHRRAGTIDFHTIDLSRADYDRYYTGFANGTLWPVLHYRPILASYEDADFDGYRSVNRIFARALAEIVQPDDVIWVHDYHLFCLAEALRDEGLANRIGFFLHTPFPAPQVLMTVPAHAELARSLCQYDLVGFQTETDRRAFADYMVDEAGGRIDPAACVHAFDRIVQTGVYPIGVDVEEIRAQAASDHRQSDRLGCGHVVISVDRLDYSKGLKQRFRAFERFLTEFPDRRGDVTYLQIAPPSRTDIPTYQAMRAELEAEAGRINGRFAELDWTPIHYLNKGFARSVLMPLYRKARVGLVTPLRDGMNLVAKEYAAAQDPDNPGVLILSQFAGAAAELSAALIVNPFDQRGVAHAIETALSMPLEERRERHADMIGVMRRNTLAAWRDRFVSDLAAARIANDITSIMSLAS